MIGKHIIEMLIEANQHISDIITKLETDSSQNPKLAIDGVNDAIRQLDAIVEELEKKK